MTRSEKEQALVTLAAGALMAIDCRKLPDVIALEAVEIATQTLRVIEKHLDDEYEQITEKMFATTGHRYGQDGTPA